MKEIVIISGKGGTGKTSITAAFAKLGGKNLVVADCDVDAADMHLLLQPDYQYEDDFYSGEFARIDQAYCTNCRKCINICAFDAIDFINGKVKIDPISCEGCGYCARICPTNAIINEKRNVGKIYFSNINTDSIMVHAKLGIGADNSGKLVAHVKNNAKDIADEEKADYVLIDGSPGIGCPVVSSISGASLVVMVTEPTKSGLHDMKRVFELVNKFKIKAACIINKADLNTEITENIELFLKENNISKIAKIPYNEKFAHAITQGKTIVDFEKDEIYNIVYESWEKIKNLVN